MEYLIPSITAAILLIVAFTAFVVLFASHYLKYIIDPKRLSIRLSRKIAQKGHYLDFIDEEKIVKYTLKMEDGYEIPLYLIPSDSDRYIILSHGHTVTHYNSYKYAEQFYRLNYNVIMYDSRGHGDNERYIITLGHLESRDLNTIINDTYDRYGGDIYLGIHGESMGAITSNLVLRYKPKLKFVISDSSFRDEMYHLRYFIGHRFNLPGCFVHLGNFTCLLRYHFSFTSISPIRYIGDNEIPVCFIHGSDDDYIPPENSQFLYDASKGYKELHFIEHANHAKCLQTDPERYFNIVREFLKKAREINERKDT